MLDIEDILFIGGWAFIGSILGFLAFAHDTSKSILDKIKRCCLSIGVGIFIAFPISIYLIDTETYSKSLSIMIGGLGAFGLPDFLLKYWPKLSNSLVNIIVSKTKDMANIDNNDDDNYHHPRFNNTRDE